jgi:hypothetical protein
MTKETRTICFENLANDLIIVWNALHCVCVPLGLSKVDGGPTHNIQKLLREKPKKMEETDQYMSVYGVEW